jgi:hypothetical protein
MQGISDAIWIDGFQTEDDSYFNLKQAIEFDRVLPELPLWHAPAIAFDMNQDNGAWPNYEIRSPGCYF